MKSASRFNLQPLERPVDKNLGLVFILKASKLSITAARALQARTVVYLEIKIPIYPHHSTNRTT